MKNMSSTAEETQSLLPTDQIAGYHVRPGLYLIPGASVVQNGVNFTITSCNATSCELLLFHHKEEKPFAVLPIPETYRIGNTYAMIVFGLNIHDFEYAYRMDGPNDPAHGICFDKTKELLDPYAKAVTGQSVWGDKPEKGQTYHARVVDDRFDLENFKQPEIPFSDLVIYEMHVRGFTKHASAGVQHPGTFDAIIEKIPYLLELGVNAVELMPIFEFDEMEETRVVDGQRLYNYWGYSPVCFFAPNTSYSASVEVNHEGKELKRLIRELNRNGIEVILDVVFNHTAEGGKGGPFFSFKGMDNNVYYMLTPDGQYYNFSGCGNTFNCNHPIARKFILDCLRYWVTEYRIDGFRFDLASIMGRNEDGSPMSKPPLLENLAFDPILSKVKLIAEAWDAGGLYQVGSFPSWNRWAEWNGKYRDDMRRFLKGDNGVAQTAAKRIMGSIDLYDPVFRGENASVNFLNCHDGFTLYDMYSYTNKHNLKNGWENTDGDNNNNSWNCGTEGQTEDQTILSLRHRMCKNAFATLLCSRGAAMFLAGDEFCNTQYGNNNAYCQDNEISWLDWSRLTEYQEIHDFCCDLIRFRKAHPVLRHRTAPAACGYPDMSLPWNDAFAEDTHILGVLFAGRNAENTQDDLIFLGINTYWETECMTLPDLPEQLEWHVVVNTMFAHTPGTDYQKQTMQNDNHVVALGGRSVVLFEATPVQGKNGSV